MYILVKDPSRTCLELTPIAGSPAKSIPGRQPELARNVCRSGRRETHTGCARTELSRDRQFDLSETRRNEVKRQAEVALLAMPSGSEWSLKPSDSITSLSATSPRLRLLPPIFVIYL